MKEKKLRDQIRRLEKNIGLLQNGEYGGCCCGKEINLIQCHIITEIGNAAEISARELSKELKVDSGLLSRTIKSLEQKRYIDRTVSEVDKRCIKITLSDYGVEKYNTINNDMKDYYSGIIKELPADKVCQVIESLELLNEAIMKNEESKERKENDS